MKIILSGTEQEGSTGTELWNRAGQNHRQTPELLCSEFFMGFGGEDYSAHCFIKIGINKPLIKFFARLAFICRNSLVSGYKWMNLLLITQKIKAFMWVLQSPRALCLGRFARK